jgi:hypothetical protein
MEINDHVLVVEERKARVIKGRDFVYGEEVLLGQGGGG